MQPVDVVRNHNEPTSSPLVVGERVIWISDSDDVEKGTVRWIGVLPDDHAAAKSLVAGVEFVSLCFKC